MLQLPTVSRDAVAVELFTVQTEVGMDVKVTGRPELADATSEICAPTFCAPGFVKVMVCVFAATTESAMLVVAVSAPDVPVTVTEAGLATAAVLLAAKVRTCVPEAVPALKAPVTPLGSPVAASVTVPVNPS